WLRRHGQNIRVHGNRFIQIDLEGPGPQYRWGDERVHIWSDLVPLAQRYGTPIHDHVFGFHSRILAGTLIDIRYKVAPCSPKAASVSAYDCALAYDVYTAMPR